MTKEVKDSFWKEFRFISHAFTLVLFLIVSSIAFSSMLGVAEGDFAPVVTNFTITKMVSNEPGTTTIWGTLDRLRDCPYEKLNFREGDSQFSEAVEVRVMVASSKRQMGHNTFGPWQVRMDRDDILHNSMATIEHSCHPGWNTTSQLYTNTSLFYGPPAPR